MVLFRRQFFAKAISVFDPPIHPFSSLLSSPESYWIRAHPPPATSKYPMDIVRLTKSCFQDPIYQSSETTAYATKLR